MTYGGRLYKENLFRRSVFFIPSANSIRRGDVAPGVGPLANFLLQGVFWRVFYFCLLRKLRPHTAASMQDLFEGFRHDTGGLVASQILIKLFMGIACIPTIIAFVAFLFWFAGVTWADVITVLQFLFKTMMNPAGAAVGAGADADARMMLIKESVQNRLQHEQLLMMNWLLAIGLLILPGILVKMLFMFA